MKRRIRLLIGLHLVALCLVTFAVSRQSWPQPARPFYLGLVFSEASFLALWGASARRRRWLRLCRAIVGLALLAAATAFAVATSPHQSVTITALVVVPASVVFFILHARRLKKGLSLIAPRSPRPAAGDLQFSLFHLFGVTMIVAFTLSVQKAFEGHDFQEHDWVRSTFFVAAIAPCVVAVDLATFWVALGSGRVLRRLLVLLPSGIFIGIVPPFYITGSFDLSIYTFWTAAFSSQVLVGAATLLVVRSCGWRLSEHGTEGDERQPSECPA
ncbi:MAG TPA: hypothetical protein VHC22_32435 [Pirellulales bacterium]|nr:hypothetical protein [Pirellulales bacterium]